MRALVLAMAVVAGCAGSGPVATQTAAPTSAPTGTAVATATGAPATGTSASLPPGVLAGGTGWGASLEADVQESELYLFQCPPNGSESTVWGTDTYTGDSSVCTAAVHVGLIDFQNGGSALVEVLPGQPTYVGSTRNGVASNDYGSWGTSFAFVDAPPPSTASPGTATPSPGGGGDAYDELLTHIPAAIRTTCTEIDPAAAAALAVANCQPEDLLSDPDAVVDDIVYVRYQTLLEATQRYAEELQEVGDQVGDDCSIGPSQVAYEIDGEVHGRLLCAPDTIFGGELVAWWYDDRLNLVGSALLAAGSYENLFDLVTAATAEP